MIKTWDEMTVLEQYACTYSNMYKDAYGVRPRGIDTSTWAEENFRAAFNHLEDVIERGEVARKEDEQRAIVHFSKRVQDTIAAGAKNRETALRWIMDADGANGDWEFLCYLNGLPYGFFGK
jgi:hypothetical protein